MLSAGNAINNLLHISTKCTFYLQSYFDIRPIYYYQYKY